MDIVTKTFSLLNSRALVPSLLTYNQTRSYAARRGTRKKLEKKKQSNIEVKRTTGFIPHNAKDKILKSSLAVNKISEENKPVPQDNVWIGRFYKWKVYDFEEAVQCFRETHHPEMFNLPNAYIRAYIELDMRTNKKTKFVDKFSKVSYVEHPFDHGETRSILAFCKGADLIEAAESAGATMVGDVDTVKKIEKGDLVLPDFNFILAHPNILPELVCLKGLLKKKFPSPKQGTLGGDLPRMIKHFLTGIQYSAARDEVELSYGCVDTVFGTLNMDVKHLEKNFESLLADILSMKPKRDGPFITNALIFCPPAVEKCKVNIDEYISEEKKDEYDSDSDDERTAAKA